MPLLCRYYTVTMPSLCRHRAVTIPLPTPRPSQIVATHGGALSIVQLPQLRNLLGARPETFATCATLSAVHATSLFVLERSLETASSSTGSEALTAAAPAAAVTAVTAVTAARGTAGGAWDGGRRVENWRLISLRQTSPEVLFERKVGLQE